MVKRADGSFERVVYDSFVCEIGPELIVSLRGNALNIQDIDASDPLPQINAYVQQEARVHENTFNSLGHGSFSAIPFAHFMRICATLDGRPTRLGSLGSRMEVFAKDRESSIRAIIEEHYPAVLNPIVPASYEFLPIHEPSARERLEITQISSHIGS